MIEGTNDVDNFLTTYTFKSHTLNSPKYIWSCSIFGPKTNYVWMTTKETTPNAWVRFWMRVFFNSRWKRL
jgi:hypothetical protein